MFFFFFVFFPITLLITQIKVFIDAELNSRRCQMVRGSSTVTSQKTFTSEFSVWWAANETLHLLSITLPLSLHFSLQPTAWHLPLCATVLTLQSLFADWPAPLSVPLSASINILLSITKWGKHAPVGTYSEMDACGCRYIRFQLFFFQALKEFNVSLPQEHIFFFFFCSVNIVKVWKDWKTTDLSNPDVPSPQYPSGRPQIVFLTPWVHFRASEFPPNGFCLFWNKLFLLVFLSDYHTLSVSAHLYFISSITKTTTRSVCLTFSFFQK